MLIIDIPLDGGATLRAGVIGSCRVRAPLRAVVRRGGARTLFVDEGVCSYTAAEAIQELAYSRGQLEIPDRFAPLLLNRASQDELPAELVGLIDTCEVFLVEISTLDHLACAGICFNDLAISQRLVRGAGPAALAWYRQLSGAPSPPAIVEAALDSMRASGKPADAVAEEVLTSLVRVRTRPEALDEQIARIIFAPDRRWIFQPLFNLPGKVHPNRAALPDHVAYASASAGAEFFDLTPLVARVGREIALNGGGVDTYHFARDFFPTVGDALRNLLIGAPSS